MDAARLDRLILVSHRELTVNAAGEHISSWPVAYARLWAEVIDLSGSELIVGGGMTAAHTTRFRIRWRSDVLQTDQITFESINYNISYIGEIGRHEGLEILATATVP